MPPSVPAPPSTEAESEDSPLNWPAVRRMEIGNKFMAQPQKVFHNHLGPLIEIPGLLSAEWIGGTVKPVDW